MDNKLAVLDAYLRELGQTSAIDSKDDRLRVQKAIYLGQLTGVDLGYRYNWYVHGPYSPTLTQDYYALDGLAESDKVKVHQAQLNAHARQKLATAAELFVVPQGVTLALHHWLELLSSWHYLRKVLKFDEQKSRDTLQNQKNHVAAYATQADLALKSKDFL